MKSLLVYIVVLLAIGCSVATEGQQQIQNHKTKQTELLESIK